MVSENKTFKSYKPFLFIFTFVKDGTNYISKLFNSLLNQNNTNFIHYIYDDGSTDNIKTLVNNYKKRASLLNNPFKIIFESNPINIGINKSTAHCIEKAKAKYFIWINADDYVNNNFVNEIERMTHKFKDVDIFATNIKYINANKYKKFGFKYFNGNNPFCTFLAKQKWIGTYYVVKTNSYFISNPTNLIVPSKTLHNDVQLCILAFINRWKWGFIKNSVAYYLEHADSAFHINGSGTVKDRLLFVKKYWPTKYEFFLDNYQIRIYLEKFEYFFANKDFINSFKYAKLIRSFCKKNNAKEKKVFNLKTQLKIVISSSKILFKVFWLLKK